MEREPTPSSTLSLHNQTTTTTSPLQGSPVMGGSVRNNEVRTVMLYGVPIIALVMDNQERLCLAQISNTLLKGFSYNEIHNRRVALGITCVQCTPVQLELLRRAGAMPVSSRRCGMITKREAERLCKSFLSEAAPPKLPDTFAFDVYHHCAWGCRGSFTPSRYNSSRAKCIKCLYCGLFFSPNKFIFHSHRLPDSKYVQPDAANFNSWRRHIKLSGTVREDILFAWEDVKAMFNGGSRKRAMTAGLNSITKNTSSQSSCPKRSRNVPSPESPHSITPSTTISDSASPKSTSAGPPYFPLIPLASKCYSLSPGTSQFSANPSIQSPSIKGFNANCSPDFRQSFAEFMWVGATKPPSLQLPYSCLLWPRPPANTFSDFNTSDLNRHKFVQENNHLMLPNDKDHHHWSHLDLQEGISNSMIDKGDSNNNNNNNNNLQAHISAFKPVNKTGNNVSSICKHFSSVTKDADVNPNYRESVSSKSVSPVPSEENEQDIDIIGEEEDEVEFSNKNMEKQSSTLRKKERTPMIGEINFGHREARKDELEMNLRGQILDRIEYPNVNYDESQQHHKKAELPSSALDLRNLTSLPKTDFHQILDSQSETNKKTERSYEFLKETLEDHVRKEMVYREEVSKQLQLVREALCHELDQERKTRITMRQKLREVNDSFHHLSYDMLSGQLHHQNSFQ